MSTFTAKYAAGICVECKSGIQPGEEISRALDHDFVHVDCPTTELDRLLDLPVCQMCWTIGSCDCDQS